MPIEIKKLKRVFSYNGMEIPDPNPNVSPKQALEIISTQFPELANGKIEPAVTEGGVSTFAIQVVAGTKG